MSKRKHRRRKEPRRMTPPLILRDDDGGRECVEVDQMLELSRCMKSGRVRAFLILGAELQVLVGSRCINKRRVAVIYVRPVNRQWPTLEAQERFWLRHNHEHTNTERSDL